MEFSESSSQVVPGRINTELYRKTRQIAIAKGYLAVYSLTQLNSPDTAIFQIKQATRYLTRAFAPKPIPDGLMEVIQSQKLHSLVRLHPKSLDFRGFIAMLDAHPQWKRLHVELASAMLLFPDTHEQGQTVS